MIARVLAVALLLIPLDACWGQWRYWAFNDPMTGELVRVAAVESTGWGGTLMVRLVDGGVLTAVGTPGTILCAEPCQIMVKLDGKAAAMRDARPPGNRLDMMYFSPKSLPFATVVNSSKIEMEVRLKEHGWRVLAFETRGFDGSRLSAAGPEQRPQR